MAMIALDAPRKKEVPVGSIEARWMINEGDKSEYIREAKKQPKMQALMEQQAEQRLADEKVAQENAKLEAAARAARLKQLGLA